MYICLCVCVCVCVCVCAYIYICIDRERERVVNFHAFKCLGYIKQNGQLDAVMFYTPSPLPLKERIPNPQWTEDGIVRDKLLTLNKYTSNRNPTYTNN